MGRLTFGIGITSFLVMTMGLISCETDNTVAYNYTTNQWNDTIYNLEGQRWILYQYRIGNVALNYPSNDTLVFLTALNYTYNHDTAAYSFYTVPGAYKLNLNGTPWGNIGGTVYENNLIQGDIRGLRFVETFTGIGAEYYLWMRRE